MVRLGSALARRVEPLDLMRAITDQVNIDGKQRPMSLTYRNLSVPERRCLGALYMPEPLANLPRVGQPSVERLLQLGLVEQAEAPEGSSETYYRRTEAGNAIHEAMWRDNAIPR